jgi:hypothetical protein
MGGMTGRAAGAAGRAGDSDALESLARIGLIAYGVVHLLVAWLAVQLAWGVGGGAAQADQSGALATLAQQPFGAVVLWVVAVGLVALAKAVAYAVLAVLAVRFATGGGRSGAQKQQQATSGVFGWPAGRWLVALVGLVVVGVGVYLVYKGVSKRFLKEIDLREAPPQTTRLVTRLGQVGYPAKGVAFGLVGVLLVWAAVTFDPARASGLDGALRSLLAVPFGQVLLTLVAVGIAAFGAFCFVRARYPERT